MDMLLIDPPYKSLKGIGVDCAYAMGLASLAGCLYAGGIETEVLTGDLLTDTVPGYILNMDAKAYARGQEAYQKALGDDGHPIWSRIADAVRECRPGAVGILFLTPDQILEVSKMIRDSGLVSMAFVLLGLPDEKPEDVERTLALMRAMDCDLFDINCYVPLPGTPLGSAMDADAFHRIDWLQTGFKSLTTNFSNQIADEQFQDFVLEAYRIAEEARTRFLNRLANLTE